MDRPSVDVGANRSSTHVVRIDSRTQIPLFRVSHGDVNKKQPFRREFDEKSLRAMRLSDANANQNRRGIAAAADFRLAQDAVQPRLSIGTKVRFSGPV